MKLLWGRLKMNRTITQKRFSDSAGTNNKLVVISADEL